MIHKLRIPQKEEYAFIEYEFEGSIEEATVEYHRLTAIAKDGNSGLAEPEWRAVLDDLLDDGSIQGDPGMMEQMNPAQKWLINEVKKSYKRIK